MINHINCNDINMAAGFTAGQHHAWLLASLQDSIMHGCWLHCRTASCKCHVTVSTVRGHLNHTQENKAIPYGTYNWRESLSLSSCVNNTTSIVKTRISIQYHKLLHPFCCYTIFPTHTSEALSAQKAHKLHTGL